MKVEEMEKIFSNMWPVLHNVLFQTRNEWDDGRTTCNSGSAEVQNISENREDHRSMDRGWTDRQQRTNTIMNDTRVRLVELS